MGGLNIPSVRAKNQILYVFHQIIPFRPPAAVDADQSAQKMPSVMSDFGGGELFRLTFSIGQRLQLKV